MDIKKPHEEFRGEIMEMYREIKECFFDQYGYELSPSEAAYIRFLIKDCFENNAVVTNHYDNVWTWNEVIERFLAKYYTNTNFNGVPNEEIMGDMKRRREENEML